MTLEEIIRAGGSTGDYDWCTLHAQTRRSCACVNDVTTPDTEDLACFSDAPCPECNKEAQC